MKHCTSQNELRTGQCPPQDLQIRSQSYVASFVGRSASGSARLGDRRAKLEVATAVIDQWAESRIYPHRNGAPDKARVFTQRHRLFDEALRIEDAAADHRRANARRWIRGVRKREIRQLVQAAA